MRQPADLFAWGASLRKRHGTVGSVLDHTPSIAASPRLICISGQEKSQVEAPTWWQLSDSGIQARINQTLLTPAEGHWPRHFTCMDRFFTNTYTRTDVGRVTVTRAVTVSKSVYSVASCLCCVPVSIDQQGTAGAALCKNADT